jgi:diaminohydroxyphosphoribosylaminopyrimidine deaminase/5-amino-6-(5-phosphoribosylamino)uracil reductase
MNTRCDIERMSQAIQLARLGQYSTRPNPNVGCVITDAHNQFIASGYHQRAGGAHAEIHALNEAGSAAKGSTVYVTLEPCCHEGKTGPCSEALIAAQVGRVVIAMQDPNPLVAGNGSAALRAAGIQVTENVLPELAAQMNQGFIKRMSQGLPWVTLKMASSLDGRNALANGQSQWITSAEARRDVHTMRARYDAIMTGIGTVLADDPSLNVRDVEMTEVMQPHRVVLDPDLKMPINAKMLSLPGNTLIVTATGKNSQAFEAIEHCEVLHLDVTQHRFDLKQLMQQLAAREINSVMVEAGAALMGGLVQQQCADQIVHYLAPCYLGEGSRGLFDLGGLEYLDQAVRIQPTDIRNVGVDVRISALIEY